MMHRNIEFQRSAPTPRIGEGRLSSGLTRLIRFMDGTIREMWFTQDRVG